MNTVTVTCPICGPVTLPAHYVRLVGGLHPFYTFTCNRCGDRTSRTATPHTIAELATIGIHPEHVPAEAYEPHNGPALTLDDAIDFHAQLEALWPTP